MVAGGESGATAGRYGEAIAGCGLHRSEALQSTRRSEALHHPLSFSEGQVAVLGALVSPRLKHFLKKAIVSATGTELPNTHNVGANAVPLSIGEQMAASLEMMHT